MSFGPTNYRRGGTRGGADQFKWDDVKNDKYRENYLGHSVQAPVGRWQKDKDLTWYTKLNREDRAAALREEIALAKQRDQELMDQALGIAPKKRAEPTGQLDAAEVKELLKRGASDREGLDGERVEGLGAAPVPQDYATKPKKTLAEKYEDELKRGHTDDNVYALRGSAAAAGGGEPLSEKQERAMKKALRKQKRKEKKARKKEKKEKKRERRHTEGEEEAHGRSPQRGDRRSLRRRSVSSSSTSSRSPSRSRSPSLRRGAHRPHDRRSRSRSRSPSRRRRNYSSPRRRSPSRSRSRGRRRSRSRSPEDRSYRRRSSPPRSRGRSHSRDRSPYQRRR